MKPINFLQEVLGVHSGDIAQAGLDHKETLLIPLYLVAISASFLLVDYVLHHVSLCADASSELDEPPNSSPPSEIVTRIKAQAAQHGGANIFSYKLARFTGCLALLCLSINSMAKVQRKGLRWEIGIQEAMLICYFYASTLALVSICSKPKWSTVVARHLNIFLLAILAIYTHRDLLPLSTYVDQPLDISEGWTLWAKIITLALTCLVIPLSMPRQRLPSQSKAASSNKPSNPEETASLFSLFTFSFLDPLIFLGFRHRQLSFDQLPPLAEYDHASHINSDAFRHIDANSQKGHLFWGLLRVFRRQYVVQVASLLVRVVSGFIAPYAVKELLHYIETDGKNAHYRPWFWILWIFAGPAVGVIASQWYTYFVTYTRLHLECVITQLVFEHSLRIHLKAETPSTSEAPRTLSKSSSDGVSNEQATASNLVGKINNLASTDLGNIGEGSDWVLLFTYIPLQIILCVAFLYSVLGWSAFVGFGILVLTSPAPGYVAKRIRDVQIIRLKKTDSRVQTVAEMISVLRMVKLFGWEKKVNETAAQKREEELVTVRRRQLLELLSGNIHFITPLLTMMATYATYVSAHPVLLELNASKVFSSISVFDMLRGQLRMTYTTVNAAVTAKVSLDRVNDFLRTTELLDSFIGKATTVEPNNGQPKNEIGFANASFSWSNDDESSPAPRRRFLLKINHELIFRHGQINLIVGPTGSGKTSLLMALLGTTSSPTGEMHFLSNGNDSWYSLPRENGVAYAAQESWVQNGTIKDNIIFGFPYDEARYKKVLYQCCLEPDLALFAAGDQIEVGERGLTLSGGQKARITLARAVYSEATTLLLDDILAALDVHTAKWVVNNCLEGDLIKGRTVLLVTHNVGMFRNVGLVISMDQDGNVSSQTPITDPAVQLPAIDQDIGQANASQPSVALEESVTGALLDSKLTTPEVVEKGRVSWKALKLYLSALGGTHPILFFLVSVGGLVMSELSNTIQVWYLGYWASQYEHHPASEVHVSHHIGVYAGLLLFAVMMYCIALVVHILGTLRASRILHASLVGSVLGATLRWLDITPTSRLIARCTQDIRVVDGPIPNGIWRLYGKSTMVVMKFTAIIIMTPMFLGPSILVTILGGFCGQIYITAQMPVKRMMSNAKAPVLGHFGATMTGLTSIRAFGAQESFSLDSLRYIDGYTRTARTFYNVNRWINVRIGLLGALFSASLAAYLVYSHKLSAGNIGFSLTTASKLLFLYYFSFSTELLGLVRDLNEFEVHQQVEVTKVYLTQANVSPSSLERIQNYLEIEQEPRNTQSGVPPAYWPASGDLHVEHLSARYSQGGARVLRDLSFQIKSGERIGVVGRTGAGKSSLTLSLLRCMLTEGSVRYDGLDTGSMNLDALRSKITIIPQIPELLSGTLRRNLDPFEQYDDATLNDALRAAGMTSLQTATSGEGKITLETFISGGGDNLSIGQRQILALARAIVRGGKLLILDEATSAIDYETDAVIQSSLRRELGKDMSLIIVAHRLQTVMDADKIMVLDAGEIVEFDTPATLLGKADGRLRALVDASGDRDALYAMSRRGTGGVA
ncbi:hypothetical protein FPV67DRAFT_1779021 [Lyophyllum atratum]|nr:hypothetical protein FPV67DRAFT_1779021 [Lyophyllum atratum]